MPQPMDAPRQSSIFAVMGRARDILHFPAIKTWAVQPIDMNFESASGVSYSWTGAVDPAQ